MYFVRATFCGYFFVLAWALFPISSLAASCSLGTHDLSVVPPAVLQIPVQYSSGNEATAWWAINPCSNKVNLHPNGTKPCFKGGFVVEYNMITCATEPFDVMMSSSVTSPTSGQLMFGRATNPGWSATLTLVCGATLELQAVGSVKANGLPDLLDFDVTVTTSAMC